MSIEQSIVEQDTKIAQIVRELGEPSAAELAALRLLLPPVIEGTTSTPPGNLATGRGRRRR